jgi:hypothetical protein
MGLPLIKAGDSLKGAILGAGWSSVGRGHGRACVAQKIVSRPRAAVDLATIPTLPRRSPSRDIDRTRPIEIF